MISSSDIRREMLAVLDVDADSGNDYYDDVRNIIPAINAAQRWVMMLINSMLGEYKFGEYFLMDLQKSAVFTTSVDGAISIGSFPQIPGSILAVMPLPEVGNTGAPAPVAPVDKKSYARPDLYHISTRKSANRLSSEQIGQAIDNPFSPGYGGVANDLTTYAYINPISYNHTSGQTVATDLRILPKISRKLCTVLYLDQPQNISVIGQNDIPFHPSLLSMIRDRAVMYISWQNGDNRDGLYVVSDKDVRTLAAMIS
jgi:hypothetical protein